MLKKGGGYLFFSLLLSLHATGVISQGINHIVSKGGGDLSLNQGSLDSQCTCSSPTSVQLIAINVIIALWGTQTCVLSGKERI